MNGLGNMAVREAMWERIVWKEGDVGSSDDLRMEGKGKVGKSKHLEGRGDGKMEWMEVLALCTKLNVSMGKEELMNLFKVSLSDFSVTYDLTLSSASRQDRQVVPHLR